ncbi:MAG: hypothetical protein E7363_06185 [Clostridiales bacterium]|nr:hypothetical protein [Clostridiales bacterium]
MKLGLQKGQNGKMLLNGKPFVGFGVNCFNLITSCYDQEGDNPLTMLCDGKLNPAPALKALETLANNGVKVVRFNAGSFYPNGWKNVMDNFELHLNLLDEVYTAADRLHIGLIPSFFWTSFFCNVFDEGPSVALRNPETNPSKTLAFIKWFTQGIVKKLKHHTSAYMWEFGNEHQLSMDIPWWRPTPLPENSVRMRATQWEDMITSFEYGDLLTWWAKIIHEVDEDNRLIGTGDAVTRPCAYNLAYRNQSMEIDTREEHLTLMQRVNGGIDAVSIHEYTNYPFFMREYGVDGHGNYGVLGEDLGTTNWKERMELFMQQCRAMNKTGYLGEFGVLTGDAFDPREYEMQARAIFEACIETGVPIALFWNYDYFTEQIPGDLTEHGTGVEYSCNERWEKGKLILSLIKEYNEKTNG